MHSVGTGWLWVLFCAFVLVVLVLDWVVLKGGRSHKISMQEALGWSVVWIVCALIFNGLLWVSLLHSEPPAVASARSLEFLTGYVIEKSLSIDNLFVILMIFQYFAVPPELQRRVLLYGLMGAFVLRFVMIFFGVWLVGVFHWVLYIFGLFLVLTGIKMFFFQETKKDFAQNSLLIWLKKHIRITEAFKDEKFFVRKNYVLYATPLFLALVFVELSDFVFAMDSVPAILAITRDPFIVFTSNMFAILGLRALYFLLANSAARFHLLKYGIALVLIFVGVKMLVEPWLNITTLFSLGVIGTVLVTTILLSWVKKKR